MRLIPILAVVLVIACNSPEKNNSNTSQTDTVELNPSLIASVRECYWQIIQRDTFVAALNWQNSEVNGNLTFDNFEKDGSTGLVTGRIVGDTLKLWYSFASEGSQSVMEVWYKRDGDRLARGIGPMGLKGDTSYFTDHSAIRFPADQSLQKVDCETVPAKYK